MVKLLTPTDTFCIEFDTKEMPGLIVATEVRIRRRIMRQQDSARVDLADHPLYPQLQSYVKGNPR